MACEVAVMNPQQMDVSAMESLYSHGSWNPALSPELGSPIYAHSPQGSVHSPLSVSAANSPVLSHVGSPMVAAAPICCSPAHSPNSMQAAHSPVMHGSPLSDNMLESVKQERFDAELRFANEDSCLTSLLQNNEMIAAQNLAMAPPHMGPPHPREILDGKCFSQRP